MLYEVITGCMTLLEEVGLPMDAIERIILAGGFGSYIDLEKAITVGLLPEIDPDRVTYIGNGSLQGARMSSLTNTTLGALLTNARLSKVEINRVAERCHDGMARAVKPVHTSYDGDVVFGLASGKIEAGIDMVAEIGA